MQVTKVRQTRFHALSFLHIARNTRYLDQTRSSIRMWHQIVERSCVNHHILSIEGESEAIQAPWSRAVQEFTAHAIVRTVTGTFEAHAVVAERYSTTQVNTALIQPDPVPAIPILANCLSTHLIPKRPPLQ